MSSNSSKVKKSLVLNPIPDPGSPERGEIFYSQSEDSLKYYNGSALQKIGNLSGFLGFNDNALLRSDGTTGRIVQGTGITIDDLNNMSGIVDLKTSTAYSGTGSKSASAIIQADSTTQGMLPPRMTTAQRNAISTPATGLLIYNTSTKFYNWYNGTSWIEIVPDSGAVKNYLTVYNGNIGNGNFETGTTSGWSLFNTTLTSGIPTGAISAGAASITTFDIITSGQLAGSNSLRTASSAAWSAGQGFISDAFNIDSEDQTKIFSFKLNYKCFANPSNGNFSGTSLNTFAVYIYDATNSAWIQPSGVYGIIQNSGAGIVTGTFQATSNSTQYRIAILAVNASSGAITMYWDDFSVGPQTSAAGGEAVVVSIFGGPAATVNTSVQANIPWNAADVDTHGSVTSASGTINVTTGNWSTQNFKITAPISGFYNIAARVAFTLASVANGFNWGIHLYKNGSSFKAYVLNGPDQFSGSTTPMTLDINQTMKLNAGDYIEIRASQNHSSSDSMTGVHLSFVRLPTPITTDVGGDGRAVSASVARSALLSLATVDTWLAYDLIRHDSHGAIQGLGTTNCRFVAPVSGYYFASAGYITAAPTTATIAIIRLAKNGVQLNSNAVTRVSGVQSYLSPSISGTVWLNAGEYLSVMQMETAGGDTTSDAYFVVNRISGPAVVEAGQTVSAIYGTNAGNTITNAVLNYIDFEDKFEDSHGSVVNAGVGNQTVALNGWRFVCPVSGKYQVNAVVTPVTAASAVIAFSAITVNGGEVIRGQRIGLSAAAINSYNSISASGIVRCLAGQYIQFGVYHDNGGNRTMEASTLSNQISIVRVGNY